MAPIRALVNMGFGHKRRNHPVLQRDFLNSILEGKGVVSCSYSPSWAKVNLHLPRAIFCIGSNNVHTDRRHGAQNVVDECLIKVVTKSGKNLDPWKWGLARRGVDRAAYGTSRALRTSSSSPGHLAPRPWDVSPVGRQDRSLQGKSTEVLQPVQFWVRPISARPEPFHDCGTVC